MVKQRLRFTAPEPQITPKRANAYLSIATILLLILIYLAAEQFMWIDNTYALVLSVVTIAMRVSLYGLRNREDENILASIILYILAFVSISHIFIILYKHDLYQIWGLVDNVADSMKICVYVVLSLIVALPFLELLKKDFREDLRSDFDELRSNKLPKSALILFGLLTAYFSTIMIIWFLKKDDESFDIIMFFFWIILSMVIILLLIVWIMPQFKDAEINRSALELKQLPTFVLLIVIAIISIILTKYVNEMIIGFAENGSLEGILMAAYTIEVPTMAVIGQAGGTPNYFSWVLFILLQDRVPALMISFMVFGAVSAMLIQNMGGVARIISGFALSITVIIPLLFIITIMTGGIAPPQQLEEILGYGTAGFVYALAQTSAFILMLAIIGVFVAGGQFLGGIMGRDE